MRLKFNLVPFGSVTNTAAVKSDFFNLSLPVQEINMDKREQLDDLSVLRCLNHLNITCFIQVPHQCLATVNDHMKPSVCFVSQQ